MAIIVVTFFVLPGAIDAVSWWASLRSQLKHCGRQNAL
jgi:hypothetical protein